MPLCFHQKLRANVTCVFAQCNRRVHPSDPANSSTTRHLGYFSNRLPALEKATSSPYFRPVIVLAAPLLTKAKSTRSNNIFLSNAHVAWSVWRQLQASSHRLQEHLSHMFHLAALQDGPLVSRPPTLASRETRQHAGRLPPKRVPRQSTQELHLPLASRRGRELVHFTQTFIEAGVVNFSKCHDFPIKRSRQAGLFRLFVCSCCSYTH